MAIETDVDGAETEVVTTEMGLEDCTVVEVVVVDGVVSAVVETRLRVIGGDVEVEAAPRIRLLAVVLITAGWEEVDACDGG